MILFPNAKINIGLYIPRRRPDGYHDIVTAMIPIPWRDILEIVPAQGSDTTLTVSGRHVDCPAERNLVMKAYRVVAEVADIPPVDIYLRKIIPDGAGLGGGSADAAFTIVALDRMFALSLGYDCMERIAATIGADCPFFIRNRPALATGTGTTLEPIDLDLNGMYVAVVKPGEGVSTAQAYAGVTPCGQAPPLERLLDRPMHTWQGCITNHFEDSVSRICPDIAVAKRRLIEAGALYASMSGSGSAVYGLFSSDILADCLSSMFPGYDTLYAAI
ncbi:MAG: 4-(cytidine 5'-diphospho)-2-C-methyl-D-erythritol kinase [Muribaculaceae bacterium]|nr:4-(cytidine 5'-diphospho)-2-C-methyl-D-erythritol kinase [Muribaculaceae bacterium]